MKSVIFLTAFALSSVSYAAATCPLGGVTTATCVSTPKAGDSELAANLFDSIAVCGDEATRAILVYEKFGEPNTAEAKAEIRMGGSSYSTETKDVKVTLTVTTGIASKTGPARLKVELKSANIVESSTYTCTR